jgi:hypothetical protein
MDKDKALSETENLFVSKVATQLWYLEAVFSAVNFAAE